jgi:hypothetical protein
MPETKQAVKEITMFTDKTCIKCGNKIIKGTKALADFNEHPYTFSHLECPQTQEEREIEASEMMYAMLADVQADLRVLTARINAMYEATFPTEKKEALK